MPTNAQMHTIEDYVRQRDLINPTFAAALSQLPRTD